MKEHTMSNETGASTSDTNPLKFFQTELAPMSDEVHIKVAEEETYRGKKWHRQFGFGDPVAVRMLNQLARYARGQGRVLVGLLEGDKLVGLRSIVERDTNA